MSDLQRRQFLQQVALGTGAIALPLSANAAIAAIRTETQMPLIRPPKLRIGDTVALISPASATYKREPFDIAIDSLKGMGFKVKEGRYLRARNGQFAGTDAERAADLNAMFADPEVKGIIAMTGGSGATRILDKLDYDLIRQHPKVLMGFSDITALLNAINVRSGLVTFHGPVAISEWNAFSVNYFKRVLMDGEIVQFSNPQEKGELPAPNKDRIHTIRGGVARGRLMGGNLSVLVTLLGTPCQPDFRNAILFIEDLNEYIYRIDRLLAHLRLAGAFKQLAGVVIGQFTDCEPGDGYGTLTLDEVFDDYFKSLNVPVFSGSLIGHIKPKFTLPVGLDVEINADLGSIKLLQAAVSG